MADGKPSFFGSVMSGITGYVKGALAGGITGVIGGAAIGAIASIFTGGLVPAVAAGALYGGTILATLGAAAGVVTGVVKHREAAQPSGEDVVNVANVAFAQGLAVGTHLSQQGPESTLFRDRIAKERAAQALAQSQQIH